MAANRVNVLTPSAPAPGARPRPLARWEGPGPALWAAHRGRDRGLRLALLRTGPTGPTPRLGPGRRAPQGGPTGPHTAPSGGQRVFCPAALVGRGLARSPLPAARPGHGRLDARTTLHDPLAPRAGTWRGHPGGLAPRRRPAPRSLAPAWGSARWSPPGQGARGLAGARAGRPGLVRALALDHDPRTRVASGPAPQAPRLRARPGPGPPSSAATGAQPCRAAVGRAGRVLDYPRTATALSPLGALGGRRSCPVVAPHGLAANGRRGGGEGLRAWRACGGQDRNRGGGHGEQTKRRAPARAERLWLAGAGATRWTVRGGCQAAVEQARPPLTQRAEHPIARKRATGQRPPRALRGFRRGRLVSLAARCLSQPWPGGLSAQHHGRAGPRRRSSRAMLPHRYAKQPERKAYT